MPESVPKPVPWIPEHHIREPVETLFNRMRSNEAQIEVAIGKRGRQGIGTEETTTSSSFADLSTPGPSATITVREGDLVLIAAVVESKVALGGGSAAFGVYEATDYPSVQQLGSPVGATTFTTDVSAVTPLVASTAGSRTYTLKYKEATGTTTASFKNRVLWVWTVSGF